MVKDNFFKLLKLSLYLSLLLLMVFPAYSVSLKKNEYIINLPSIIKLQISDIDKKRIFKNYFVNQQIEDIVKKEPNLVDCSLDYGKPKSALPNLIVPIALCGKDKINNKDIIKIFFFDSNKLFSISVIKREDLLNISPPKSAILDYKRNAAKAELYKKYLRGQSREDIKAINDIFDCDSIYGSKALCLKVPFLKKSATQIFFFEDDKLSKMTIEEKIILFNKFYHHESLDSILNGTNAIKCTPDSESLCMPINFAKNKATLEFHFKDKLLEYIIIKDKFSAEKHKRYMQTLSKNYTALALINNISHEIFDILLNAKLKRPPTFKQFLSTAESGSNFTYLLSSRKYNSLNKLFTFDIYNYLDYPISPAAIEYDVATFDDSKLINIKFFKPNSDYIQNIRHKYINNFIPLLQHEKFHPNFSYYHGQPQKEIKQIPNIKSCSDNKEKMCLKTKDALQIFSFNYGKLENFENRIFFKNFPDYYYGKPREEILGIKGVYSCTSTYKGKLDKNTLCLTTNIDNKDTTQIFYFKEVDKNTKQYILDDIHNKEKIMLLQNFYYEQSSIEVIGLNNAIDCSSEYGKESLCVATSFIGYPVKQIFNFKNNKLLSIQLVTNYSDEMNRLFLDKFLQTFLIMGLINNKEEVLDLVKANNKKIDIDKFVNSAIKNTHTYLLYEGNYKVKNMLELNNYKNDEDRVITYQIKGNNINIKILLLDKFLPDFISTLKRTKNPRIYKIK